MSQVRRIAVVAGAVALILLSVVGSAEAIDAICKNCGRPFAWLNPPADYRADYPGGGAGNPRLRGPCCECDCSRLPNQLREEYQRLRRRWQALDEKRKAGTITPAETAEALRLSGEMEHLAQLLQNILEECGLAGDIFNDTPFTPAPPKPGENRTRDRRARDAASGERTFQQMTANDRQALEMIGGFFESKSAGFGPMPGGFNGPRAAATKANQARAAEFRKQVELLKVTGNPVDADAGDFKEVPKIKLPSIDVKKGDPEVHKYAVSAFEARLRAHEYLAAHQVSMRRHLAAKAAGDEASAARQLTAMMDFAYLSREYAEVAADKLGRLNNFVLTELDRRLSEVTKNGGLETLIAKVQAEIKEKGLPADLVERFREAGFDDKQIDESRQRLLAATEADMRKFLAAYRDDLKNSRKHTPDWYVAASLMQSARLALKPAK